MTFIENVVLISNFAAVYLFIYFMAHMFLAGKTKVEGKREDW